MRILTASLATAAALGLIGTLVPNSMAVPVIASDDSYIAITDFAIPTPAIRDTADPKLSIQDHNGSATQNRLSAIRFDNLTFTGPSSGSSLSLTVSGQSSTAVAAGTTWNYQLYGVLESANGLGVDPTAEDNMDESTYSAANANAIDSLGNNINENFIYDADAVAAGDQPIATLSILDGAGRGDVLTFSGADFDTFISTVTTNAADDDVAFILRLAHADSNGRARNDLFSLDTGTGAQRPTLDVVIPEPASLALIGLGGLMMVGRRRK